MIVIGLVIGLAAGVIIMCILQVNQEKRDQ